MKSNNKFNIPVYNINQYIDDNNCIWYDIRK